MMPASRLLALLAVAFLVAFAVPATAQQIDSPLANPTLEARARALHNQLRCLVCQNQTIAESDADLARDLRIIVRERILAGDTDPKVLDYVVARFGDWVLMKPPFKASTLLLWLGPVVILLLAGAGVAVYLRRHTGLVAAPLSEDERRRIDALLNESADEPH